MSKSEELLAEVEERFKSSEARMAELKEQRAVIDRAAGEVAQEQIRLQGEYRARKADLDAELKAREKAKTGKKNDN